VTPSKRFNRRARLTYDQAKHWAFRSLPFIFIAALLLYANSLFIIHKVDCVADGDTCPGEVLNVLDKLVGSNSMFINQKEVEKNIRSIFPVKEVRIYFKKINTLQVKLQEAQSSVLAEVYLVNDLPVLSIDQAPSTTDSAAWWTKPSTELEEFLSSKSSLSFNIFSNGNMISTSTESSPIKYIFSQKPEAETISEIYQLLKLVSKYTDYSQIFIINKRFFLSQQGQPDIIILVPFNEEGITHALQSLSYLVTIKKDTKVIDLSFKNPIIR
jgi:hypothetical protein